MVLSIDDVRPWNEVILYALLVLAGSIWYTLLSYLVYRLRPYRLVQQILRIHLLDYEFLRAKAKFYHQGTDLEKNYADLLQLQVLVSNEDEVREILFKN